MTTILFPSETFDPETVDSDFSTERRVALEAGFQVALVEHTAIENKNAEAAFAYTKAKGKALYRGWMLKPDQYKFMYESLQGRGVELLTSPEEYELCHYFPNCYPAIADYTPKAVWTPCGNNPSSETIRALADSLGSNAFVVKDYAKSQKGYWDSACYVPDAADTEHMERVVRLLLTLQGPYLNEGLVFKEFVPNMGHDFRTFWANHKLLLYPEFVPLDWLHEVASKIQSNFFTLDVAIKGDGSWTVVEVGDGQVSSVRKAQGPFYKALYEALQ